jgi:hypothetical protein
LEEEAAGLERECTGVEWGSGKKISTPCLNSIFETALTRSLRVLTPGVSGLQNPESPALLDQNCKIKFVDMCVCKKSMFMR